eukprot:35142_1
MIHLLLFIISMVIPITLSSSSNCSSTYTTTTGNSRLPNKDTKIAVGYNTATRTVVLIGGELHPNQFFTFMVDTDTFVDYNANYTEMEIHGSASYYAQVDNTLWMLSKEGDAFITLDLQSSVVNQTKVQFPSRTEYGAACLTSSDQFLFIVGGDKHVHAVQIYNISGDNWLDHVPILKQGRRAAACAVVNSVLYTIGGTSSQGVVLDTIETLDFDAYTGTANNGKVLTQTLHAPLHGANAVEYGSDILVIGGTNDVEYISGVTVIDTVTQSVAICGSLSVAAAYIAPIVVDQTLFMFGGYNNKRNFSDWQLDSYQMIGLPQLDTTTAEPDTTTGAPNTGYPTLHTSAPTMTAGNPSVAPIVSSTTAAPIVLSTTATERTSTAQPSSTSTSQSPSAVVTPTPVASTTTEGGSSDHDHSDKDKHKVGLILVVVIASAVVVVFGILACVVCKNRRPTIDANDIDTGLLNEKTDVKVEDENYHLL